MRIIIDAQPLLANKRSGLKTYTEELINNLEKYDEDNQYLLTYQCFRSVSADFYCPDSPRFSRRVMGIPGRLFPGRAGLLFGWSYPRLFKSWKADVFHRPFGSVMPNIKGVYKVLTLHDLRSLEIQDVVWKQNIGQYVRTFKLIDKCVVVSETTRKAVLKYFDFPEEKIEVVPLAVGERFEPKDSSRMEQARTAFRIDRPYFLAFGSVPRKNTDRVIRAFARSRARNDFQLVIVGSYDGERLKEIIEENGVAHQVRLLSQVKDKDLEALYSGCHGLLFPSLYEGFGLPILEAMRCEVPVLTSNQSACVETAGDAAMLVDPKNIDEMTAAIDSLASETPLRLELIQKGRERVKMFSWEKFAHRMKKVYEQA